MSSTPAEPSGAPKRITARDIRFRKSSRGQGARIAALTAYDYPSALACEAAGVEIVLVGDSLSMVVLGHEDTLSVTLDEMLHHCRAVARGSRSALLVGDMPFMSYHASARDAVRSAGRFVKEGRMHAVKLEGGSPRRLAAVRAIVEMEIPLMGHVGLTPQSLHRMGGYRVQGKSHPEASRLMDEARALEEAGVFALVLEGVPRELASEITAGLAVPTIGIGAGPGCDGQILVYHDLLGLLPRPPAKFVRRYLEGFDAARAAIEAYVRDLRSGNFPSDEECYHAPREAPRLLGGGKG
jgi:3-methyl-2-oxobutanoate hydroxymethyltransferase